MFRVLTCAAACSVIFTVSPAHDIKLISDRVATTDIAVTLADIFATTQPSGASGTVLRDVVE